MDNQLCACDTGLKNSGLPNCEIIMKAARKFAFTPNKSFAGVVNRINPADTLDQAWITALLNNTDKSERIYPSPELKNITFPKDAPQMETFKDKSSNFVSENVRKVMALLPEAPPRFKANFESIRCNSDTRFYIIDKYGNLIGMRSVDNDGYLYPIPMNVKSVVAGYKFADDENSSQIELQFEIPTWVDDSLFCMISAAKFTDFNMQTISGLLDADVTFSNIASGSVTASIFVENNTLDNPTEVEGLVTADFISSVTSTAAKIRNTTDDADVTVVAAESSAGDYDLTFTLAAAKVVVVFAELDGIDFSLMKSRNFTTV